MGTRPARRSRSPELKHPPSPVTRWPGFRAAESRSSTLPAMSVDLSGEITAIATAVLAAFAIVTAWYARRAFGWRGRGARAGAVAGPVRRGPRALAGAGRERAH
jgi:hypothetical protein